MNTDHIQEQPGNWVQGKHEKMGAQNGEPNGSGSMAMLMHAAKYGMLALLREQLLAGGTDLINVRDEYGDTALIIAARNGRTGIVKELLQVAGVDVNARREHGKTALMHAAKNGKIEMVKDLLRMPGINLDVVDKYGRNALMYAEEDQHDEIAQLIRSAR